jgi:hypothetical protein
MMVDNLFLTYWNLLELGPDAAPPLDENGIPRYRGRKRGRKPKERKRKVNPNRRKRAHTAYTLFVHERYPIVKSDHPDWQSKEVISVVARMWAEIPKEEKRTWKERAQSTVETDNPSVVHDGEEDEDGDDEADEEDIGVTDLSMLGHAEGAASAGFVIDGNHGNEVRNDSNDLDDTQTSTGDGRRRRR